MKQTNQVNEVLEKMRNTCGLKEINNEHWQHFGESIITEYPVQLNHLLWVLQGTGIYYVDGSKDQKPFICVGGTDKYADYDLQKSVEDNLQSNPELTKWVHGVIIGK